MRPDAQNLEAISAAIDHHTKTCGDPLLRILLNPYELERLQWEEIRGIPLVADSGLGTGRFRLVCAAGHGSDEGAAQVAEVEPEVVEQREPIYARGIA